jgi:hypothetical protein
MVPEAAQFPRHISMVSVMRKWYWILAGVIAAGLYVAFEVYWVRNHGLRTLVVPAGAVTGVVIAVLWSRYRHKD